jgi:hypothetical protein
LEGLEVGDTVEEALRGRVLEVRDVLEDLEAPPIGDFLRLAAGTTLPTVASPGFSDEPAYSDDHLREGDPEIDDSIPALGTPHELLVSVSPGVRALYYPTFRGP